MIPTIVGRENFLSDLVCDLIRQCGSIKTVNTSIMQGCAILVLGFENVEIIVAKDDKALSTGSKRNLLLSLAKNDMIFMCDDDDFLYPYFVEEALKAIQTYPDCVEYDGIMTTDGGNTMPWQLRMGVQNETISIGGVLTYLRQINHISIVKKELALQAGFNNVSNAEDKYFSERLRPLLKTAVRIDKKMYHYRFQSQNKSYT